MNKPTIVSIAILMLTAGAYAAPKEVNCQQTLETGQVGFTYRDATSTGQPTHVRVDVDEFKKAPPIGAEVLVLPYPKGEPVKLKVEKTSHLKLEDATHTSLRRLTVSPNRNPDYPSNVLILWPIPAVAPRLVETPKALPPHVHADTVAAAVSWTGANSPDGLYVSYCCNDRKRATDCDYTCTETWQKVDNRWQLCNSSQPL